MTQKTTAVEVIPAQQAAQLDQHEKNIRLFVRGFRKASAETFGYAFLAGREMLQAKELVPHGNADANGGLKKWLAAKFPQLSYRTCASWMVFARNITERSAALPPLKKRPLLLGNAEITEKDQDTILKVIPLVMDGKGMLDFMRDCKLLRDPEKQKHHAPKEITAQEEMKLRVQRAKRGWASVRSDHDTWKKEMKLLPAEELQLVVDSCVDVANAARELLKKQKAGEQKETKEAKG